ncbi:MAG: heparinase II/III family protein [Gemmatimonadota bacterium]|nr:heparinase II/III family protein [Gemmatimonadota bacterium]
MALLLPPDRWPERRAVAAGPLAPLADSLAAELEPVLAKEVYIPREKAVLSREGGRCGVDGSLLDFDPFDSREHRCGVCGRVYRGELHERFWLYWYQLWLAERAVHAALLYRLRGDERHAALARAILTGYAEQYLRYPNRDNVLGPGRVFFSTYIESIWLLQLCIALDLLEEARGETLGGVVRERLIEPSAALIAVYNEGLSNRQTWNNAALIAANVVLGREEAVRGIVDGGGGLVSHLSLALLTDGTWYEGENYHLFAHRGLWYGVTLLERLGVAVPRALVARFQEGFATPLLTALPDLTLVSRRDSQYAVSLRQVRFAELCELGLARSRDDRLTEMLHTLYAPDVPRGDTGRCRSTADVERNLPPTGLTRADLGWRSLLHALPTLPAAPQGGARSVLLDAQGIAVLRRERGRVYVALDYGHSGGGHGHPDRLNLLLADGNARWLDDMGTGSYVDRTLFWYRSTLAHNTPLIDGRSQERVHGRLLAYEERPAAGWVDAAADELAPGVRVRRTLIVMPDYLLETVTWSADRDVTLDLPVHVDGELGAGERWRDATLTGGLTPEDGFEFVHDAQVSEWDAAHLARLAAKSEENRVDVWFHVADRAEWWRALAPGPPGAGERRFHLLRLNGAAGSIRSVWSWAGAVTDVSVDGEHVHVTLTDGTRHVHMRRKHGWHIDLVAGGARSSIDLGGLRDETLPVTPSAALYGDATATARKAAAQPVRLPRTYALGERHYRRSEESWEDAGRPTATVSIGWAGAELCIDADVAKATDPVFVPSTATNPYDNEPPDINGDGLQVYLRTSDAAGAWILIPEPHDGAVRVRSIPGWGDLHTPRASWRRTATGYAVRLAIPVDESVAREGMPIEFDVIVNETVPGRERRRGQLVLSGAVGEFAYLAGDRHDPARLLSFVLEP